ncbi:phage tail protein [Dyella sp.]|uniref:phage tail protein n=1 Tax=Dyella sp. TaxID=1869338 RepID=UPI002ED3F9DA
MTDVFTGQIMMAGFNFAPRTFAMCNGQILPISQNAALFSLLATQYGGDGSVTFALPDLRSRTPVGAGPSQDPAWQPTPYVQGELDGVEQVSLLLSEMPAHTHAVGVTTNAGVTRLPTSNIYASTGTQEPLYAAPGSQVGLNQACVSTTGGSQPHSNVQPFLTINFMIALSGIYPSRG